jgi:probable HAF family extracellular repeat protein
MNTLTKSVAAIALMAWSLCALGQTYSITELPTLGGSVFGSAVNDSGQVTGLSYLSDGVTEHAFIYSNGVMQDLGTLGGKDSAGYEINDSGQVTGNSAQSNNSTYHAFIYSNGLMQDIGTLGGAQSGGAGINKSGQVTGFSSLSDDASGHAFIYSNGVMLDIGALGGSFQSFGLSINDSGQVTGASTLSDNTTQRAFLYSSGQMVDLNTLIDPNSPLARYATLIQATGISNAGNIVAMGTDSRYPGIPESILLIPEANVAPIVNPTVTGMLGTNGWYVSPTTISWMVRLSRKR